MADKTINNAKADHRRNVYHTELADDPAWVEASFVSGLSAFPRATR
jgi:hypothetical protein